MATTENNGLLTYKDEAGNLHLLYPVTKAELVDGLDEVLEGKVDKVTGKGLSTNDYTTTEKNKLAGIAAGANNYILPVGGSAIGGVKNGGDVNINSSGNMTVNDGAITPSKLATSAKPLNFTSKTVSTSAWSSNSTYSDYAYRASVTCSGVTANHFPEVVFSPADATSGNFAPVAQSYSGGVYIYAKSKPTATVTIPNIVCFPLA